MLNFLRNTYAVLRRELTRLAHQPMYFVLMLVLPVVSFAFFALLFNKGVARDIPIAVLDQDHTSLSRKVTQMIDDTATAMVSYGIQDMDEGERLMREGKIMAIVQIPAFFEKNILSNSQTHIETYISGTNITVNGLLSKDIQTAVTTFSGGIQIQLLTKQGLTELQAMAQRYEVARMLKKGDTYIAVAEKTGASSATISRVNRCLLYGANGYNIAIERENAEK